MLTPGDRVKLTIGEAEILPVSATIIAMEPIRAARRLMKEAADHWAIGRRLIATRRARGFLRPVDLANATGIGTNTIAMWETGQRRPSVDHAAMLVAVLRVTLNWIYLGDEVGMDWKDRELILVEIEKLPAEQPTAREANVG